jgi:hypothetical protein
MSSVDIVIILSTFFLSDFRLRIVRIMVSPALFWLMLRCNSTATSVTVVKFLVVAIRYRREELEWRRYQYCRD